MIEKQYRFDTDFYLIFKKDICTTDFIKYDIIITG